jgi:hypothetical protein
MHALEITDFHIESAGFSQSTGSNSVHDSTGTDFSIQNITSDMYDLIHDLL